jgi:anti-sigma factor RsiW
MIDRRHTALTCPADEIAAYIDGEIGEARESELEAHFAACEVCMSELNEQKQFLCGLNSSLRQEGDLELPANFTKLIVANADSTVSGLRVERERFNALFICVALALFGLFAMGTDAGRIFGVTSGVIEQIAAVGGFFGRLVYSIFVGVAVILRSIVAPFDTNLVVVVVFGSVIAVSLMLVSRELLRFRRV